MYVTLEVRLLDSDSVAAGDQRSDDIVAIFIRLYAALGICVLVSDDHASALNDRAGRVGHLPSDGRGGFFLCEPGGRKSKAEGNRGKHNAQKLKVMSHDGSSLPEDG